MVDLNGDGKLDVLCNTWSQLGSPGALLGYEVPFDWQNEEWPRYNVVITIYTMTDFYVWWLFGL